MLSSSSRLHQILAILFLLLSLAPSPVDGEEGKDAEGEDGHHEEEVDPYAVLFPWFVMGIGTFIYYLTSRYFHAVPYTAIMFLVGTLMGVGAALSGNSDQLTISMKLWADINGEVILLVFLPGLLFWDALDVNFRLFCVSFGQLVIMAFPMVLAGASLTALVAYYVFPYSWPFMLCMTFGSILSATDPVAVAALMKEVGAPPRLKMHISGESMLNDGSAVVFYTIFSNIFLYGLDIGLGQTYTVGEGFALFFRMSLGGAALGIAFGLGLITLLYYLNRRLDLEENVVQVATTATVAYLSFYTAEISCGMSGVISVVMTGITTATFGGGMINSRKLMESFWHIVEHVLNTVLFSLGGVVWGTIISNSDERASKFHASDWGYLFLLYILVNVIRFALIFGFYPLLARIGLGLNWHEALFLGYSGLRGAVGIALAVSLDNEVFAATTEEDVEARDYTATLFGHVGGIAFLTLWINGTLAGPLLKKLGLAKPTETRERVVKRFEDLYYFKMLDDFVFLLADPRFASVDFAVVRDHVPELRNLTAEELRDALKRNKNDVAAAHYKTPNVKNVLSYIEDGNETWADELSDSTAESSSHPDVDIENIGELKSNEKKMDGVETANLLKELRLAFLDMVKASFESQVEKGELDSREDGGVLYFDLIQSCDFAADRVVRGDELAGWEATAIPDIAWVDKVDLKARRVLHPKADEYKKSERSTSAHFRQLRFDVYRALSFIAAHRRAQERFSKETLEGPEVGDEIVAIAKRVLLESDRQVTMAEDLIRSMDREDVCVLVSHLFCVILLNKVAREAERLQANGILHEKEARKYLDKVDKLLRRIEFCSERVHPGQHEKKEPVLAEDEKSPVSVMLIAMKAASTRHITATHVHEM